MHYKIDTITSDERPNVKNFPEYISIPVTDYKVLVNQNEKIDEILKTLELIKDRLEIW